MSLIGGRSVKAHAFVSSVATAIAMNGCVTAAATALVRVAIGEATTTVSSAVQTSRLEVSFQ